MLTSRLLAAPGRLGGSVIVGVGTGVVTGALTDTPLGVLVGIAATGVVFVLTGWILLWPMDAEATHRHAHQEAFNPVVEELVIVAAAVGALVSIVFMLVHGGSHSDPTAATAALAGVFMAWAGMHLMYAARYANLYYTPDVGVVDVHRAGSSLGDLHQELVVVLGLAQLAHQQVDGLVRVQPGQ
ncbi:hypothetical protein BHQ19_27580, partial [Mycolicibacterium porcinum]